MHRFVPPPKPAHFDTSTIAYRTAVAAAIAAGQEPVFREVWQDHKADFFESQRMKCGFCEENVIVDHGAVEHFQPKGEVWLLKPDSNTWGKEQPRSVKVKGRERIIFSEYGYWWLAYAWENYLFACRVCNSSWKGSYFPVLEDPRPPVDIASVETHLLLNPFRGELPLHHLDYGELGEIQPHQNSVRGEETIKTCGLDRPSLQSKRQEIAKRTYKRLKELASAQTARESDLLLEIIHDDGHENGIHCGMVRTIFEHVTGRAWAELDDKFR